MYPDPLVTEIMQMTEFFRAEDYHQKYFLNNPYQPYCSSVISPKVDKFRKNFNEYLKK